MLLRSMEPEVIEIDELGSLEELDALRRAASCGCRILATVHGESLEEVQCRFGSRRFGDNPIGGSCFGGNCYGDSYGSSFFGSSYFGIDRSFWDSFFGLYLVLCREGGKCVIKQVLEGGEVFA